MATKIRAKAAHGLASFVTCSAHLGAGGALEDAIVSHEGHQGIEVVTVPAVVTERCQILDRHRHLLAASPED
jgi:hypothetical protein